MIKPSAPDPRTQRLRSPRTGLLTGGLLCGLLAAFLAPALEHDPQKLRVCASDTSATTFCQSPLSDEQKAGAPDAGAALIQQYMQGMERLRSPVGSTHLDPLLSPETLVNRPALHEASGQLDAWERALTVLEERHSQMEAELGKHEQTRAVLDSTTLETVRRMIGVSRSLIGEIRLLHAFMTQSAGPLQLRGGELLFSSDDKARIYRMHMTRIKETSREFRELDRALKQRMDDMATHLQGIAGPATAH